MLAFHMLAFECKIFNEERVEEVNEYLSPDRLWCNEGHGQF